MARMSDTHDRFIFATGIECSYPTIAGADGRTRRIDALAKTFHYDHWRDDLALVRQLGLSHLRYGLPYYRVHAAPDSFDWEFADEVFAEMQRLDVVPIVDLCHFGLPDWLGDFQNPDFPAQFARYARAFAERFPWVRLYTPVNEIYVCAKLSALEGLWNERRRDERSFVTALTHLCRANVLAIREIQRVRPDAVFIQSESAEEFHAGATDDACRARTRFENERRFLSLDLLLSHPSSAELTLYLLDNGVSRDDLRWFMHHGLDERIVVGIDFYERNEQLVLPGGGTQPAGEIFGWASIARQYHARYRRLLMHTETNPIGSVHRSAADAPRWLWKEFLNVRHLRQEGVPVLGFTWYSLIDQVDWDSALAFDRGVVNPVGLFDLQRRANPVAEVYREVVRQFGDEPLVPGGAVLGLPPREVARALQRGPRAPAAPPDGRAARIGALEEQLMESRAKLFGHPIHPMLIVFPLGLLVMAVIFDALAYFTGNLDLGLAAYWMIAAGVISGLVAAVFGAVDFMAIPNGTRAKRVGLWHGAGNVVVVALFAVAFWMRMDTPGHVADVVSFGLMVVATLIGAVTGWLGGELVDRLGVGVDRGAHLNAPSSLSGRPADEGATSATHTATTVPTPAQRRAA